MPNFNKGAKVRLKRNIFRPTPDYYEIRARFMEDRCGISYGCDICFDEFRKTGMGYALYAKEGDTGQIIEVYKPKGERNTGKSKSAWKAIVKMNTPGKKYKHFRLTSLDLFKD